MKLPETMKAAVLREPGKIGIEEIPVPEINSKEVLIAIKACGICGSDLLGFRGKHPRMGFPEIMGHELTGEVVKTGSDVTGVKAGARVTVTINIPCGECWACRHGYLNHCQVKKSIGHGLPGGFAEYMKAPAGNIVELPDNISYVEGALAETLAVAYNSISHKARVTGGEIVLVIGGGPIGQVVTAMSKACGALVIVSEILENRLEIAKQMGADIIVNPEKEDLSDLVMSVTKGRGVDISVETVGGEAVGTLRQAVKLTRPKGKVVIMGTNSADSMDLPITTFKEKELTMLGSKACPGDTVERALMLMERKQVDVNPLIKEFPFARVEEAFAIAETRKNELMKLVLTF